VLAISGNQWFQFVNFQTTGTSDEDELAATTEGAGGDDKVLLTQVVTQPRSASAEDLAK
jgi:hypothetical protein